MKNTVAYYLKYRPQTLSEIVGQEVVKNILMSSFKAGKLSHAYLFVGPRGSGKTSTARILAKMVNCQGKGESGKGEVPCNECDICISITDGSNLDLIEIDAASNRGIEDIRELRDKIKLSPTSSKKKVYIIDEVHMLTTEAFNALLKTLEEPPSHALFILATTDAGKIPQTILSRVQRLDFKLAKEIELMEVLKRIVMMEKIEIDEEALKLLIKKSDGSFRDGVKLLDQVSSMEGKITAEILEKALKSSNFDVTFDLIKSFSKKDAKQGLEAVLKQVEVGVDSKELILNLMDSLRNLVFIKNGLGEQLVKSDLTEDKYQSLLEISKSLSNKDLVRILDILQNSLEKMKTASIPSLPLELAVVEICSSDKQSLPFSDEKGKSEEISSIGKNQTAEKSGIPDISETKESNISDLSVIRHTDTPTSPDSADILKLKEKWTFVLETIRPLNFSLEALLRSINVKECTESEVFMEVPYSFHQRILEAPKNRDLLEGVLSDVLGRSIRILVSLGNRPERKEDIANIEVAADDEIIRAAAEIFNSDTIN